MKTFQILPVLAWVGGLSSLACNGKPEASAAPTASAETPMLDPGDEIPTQEEADQAAEKQITEDNADAELEKLEKELENAPEEGPGG